MVAYRLASYGNPLRTEPARGPGRYHDGSEDTPTQYMCLHPLGPFAELTRQHSLRTAKQIAHIRQRTWALRVQVEELTEITFDNASNFGLEARDLVADDPSRCQELARSVRSHQAGIIVPSAALPGTSNAVLFGARVGSPYLLEPLGQVDVPASITAEGGGPPLSLLSIVRFTGTPHAALTSWLSGDDFTFEEPSWQQSA